jgi:hypothetical protein
MKNETRDVLIGPSAVILTEKRGLVMTRPRNVEKSEHRVAQKTCLGLGDGMACRGRS